MAGGSVGAGFVANSRARSLDIGTALAASHALQDIDHVFCPELNADNVAGLGVLARVALALSNGTLDSQRLASALGRGQWERALAIASSIVRVALASPEHILAAAVAVLHVPSCLVDLFALGVTKSVSFHDEESLAAFAEFSPASFGSPEMLKAVAGFAARNPTKTGLMRLTTFGSINWLTRSELYEFNFDSEFERKRFERYTAFLRYVSENPSTYSEVMKFVFDERWVEANDLASQRLSDIGLPGGASVLNPPSLADFLILALTPWGDPLEIVTKLKKAASS